jgi:hypothetical protein
MISSKTSSISYIERYPIMIGTCDEKCIQVDPSSIILMGGVLRCATVSIPSSVGKGDNVHIWYRPSSVETAEWVPGQDVLMITRTTYEEPQITHVYPNTRTFPLIYSYLTLLNR